MNSTDLRLLFVSALLGTSALSAADSAPQPPKPMPPPSIPNTVDYVETPSRDLPQTKAFFTALLGWRFTEYGPDYLAFEDGRLNGGSATTSGSIDAA